MQIKEIFDLRVILPLHEEIFGTSFPISSFEKKSKNNKLHIFVYEEDLMIGYSIVVEKEEERDL